MKVDYKKSPNKSLSFFMRVIGLPDSHRDKLLVLYSQKKPKQKFELFVRVIGLEPTHLAAPDPKSGVSTNFTTPASNGVQIYVMILISQFFG